MSHDPIELLRECAATFRRYEELHRAKGTVDGLHKAAANADSAFRIEAALEAPPDTEGER